MAEFSEAEMSSFLEDLLSSETFTDTCESTFKEADKNGDGVLQKSEILGILEKQHAEAAETLSGQDKERFLSFKPDTSVAEEVLRDFDSNHDGVLDLQEYIAYCKKLFRGG